MQTTEGMRMRMTAHAESQRNDKGIKPELIESTFEKPDRVYPSKKYEGQFRVTGNGICLVGVPTGDEFKVITIYQDGVMTPPRADQLNTPEGQRYAARYQAGLSRGNEYFPRARRRNNKTSVSSRHAVV